MSNSKLRFRAGIWSIGAKTQERRPPLILLSVRRGGAKHGPRQVETEDVPPEPCQGDRIAAGATAEVERPAIPTALPLLLANRNSTAFGGDWTNPATVSGALHAEPARESMLGT